jgi:hypothetical protein
MVTRVLLLAKARMTSFGRKDFWFYLKLFLLAMIVQFGSKKAKAIVWNRTKRQDDYDDNQSPPSGNFRREMDDVDIERDQEYFQMNRHGGCISESSYGATFHTRTPHDKSSQLGLHPTGIFPSTSSGFSSGSSSGSSSRSSYETPYKAPISRSPGTESSQAASSNATVFSALDASAEPEQICGNTAGFVSPRKLEVSAARRKLEIENPDLTSRIHPEFWNRMGTEWKLREYNVTHAIEILAKGYVTVRSLWIVKLPKRFWKDTDKWAIHLEIIDSVPREISHHITLGPVEMFCYSSWNIEHTERVVNWERKFNEWWDFCYTLIQKHWKIGDQYHIPVAFLTHGGTIRISQTDPVGSFLNKTNWDYRQDDKLAPRHISL